MSKKVVIVGAGLAGLNCARILKGKGCEVTVFEEKSYVGGRVATDSIGGFLFDHGFQVINPAYPEIKRSGVLPELRLRALPKGVEILIDSSRENQKLLLGDPRTNPKYLRDLLSSKSGRLSEKLNLLGFMIRKSPDQELLAALKSGGAFYERAIKPFLRGVFLDNPDVVSSDLAQQYLHWFRKGSPGVPEKGVAQLPISLASGIDIIVNQKVFKLENKTVHTSDYSVSADVVVVAASQGAEEQLLQKPKQPMNQSVTWYHCVPKRAITSKHLRIDSKGKLLNSLPISNIAPSYAPNDKTLISTSALAVLSDQEVLKELSAIWELGVENFEFLQRYVIPESLPRHLPGKPLRSGVFINPNLYVIGDHRTTPSQNGAMESGRLAAEEIIADL